MIIVVIFSVPAYGMLRLASFIGIANSFDQYPRDWHQWYQSSEPENTPLPGEWEHSCNELQRMLIIRSLRPDRVPFCVTTFIINNLDVKSVNTNGLRGFPINHH